MSSRSQEMKMMDDARKRFGEIYTDVRSVDTLITDTNVMAWYWAFNDFYELFLVKYIV